MTREERNADAEADAGATADPETILPARGEGGSVGAKVDSVLEAAERVADNIRDDAREWAREHKEKSRRRADEIAAERLRELSGLTHDLRSRARAIAEQCDELIAGIESAARPSTDNGAGAQDPSDPPNSEEAAAGFSSGEEGTSTEHGDPEISDRARLLAGQMIAAGESREKITLRLREEFGLQDASAMLDRMGA